MKLLNITFSVEKSVEHDFLDHIRRAFIPRAVSAGLYNALLSQVVPYDNNDNESEATSYALQMRAPSPEALSIFLTDAAPGLLDEVARRWGEKVLMFATTLNVIYDHNGQPR